MNVPSAGFRHSPGPLVSGGGGLPTKMDYTARLRQKEERGTFFKVQVHERVGILLVEYEREKNLSFGSVKGPIGLTDEFTAL